MKKRLSIYLLICFLFAIFISCSNNILNGSYVIPSNKSNIKIVASSLDFCVSFNRTLMPAAWYSDELDFYIYGKMKNGSEETALQCSKINFQANDSSGLSGIVYFEFEKAVYELYLAAVPKGKEFNNAQLYMNTVLLGVASVDLNYGESIVFYLSPTNLDSVDNAYGSAFLYLYTKNWDISSYSDYTVKAGIYDQITGALVKDNALQVVSLPAHYSDENLGSLPPSSYNPEIYVPNYVLRDITPGTYNFVVNFINDENTYCFNTTIRIFSNNPVQENVLIPNVIDLPPETPGYFYAGYQDPASSSDRFFYIEFDWDDSSTNESYYQLEILDLSNVDISDGDSSIPSFLNGDVIANNSYWNNFIQNRGATVTIFKDSDLDDKMKIDGSLVFNSNFVVIRQPLGTCSIARICAVNDAGKSEYIYADIYNGTNFKSSECNVSSWNLSSRFINRFRVSYNLSVGNFYDNDSGSLVSSLIIPDYYTNAIYNGVSYYYAGGFSVINPVSYSYNNNTSHATLKYYDENSASFFSWKSWQIGSEDFVTEDTLSSTFYKDFKNVTFFATFDGDYKIGDSEIFSHCSCDTQYDADIYVTADNTDDYMFFNYGEEYFIPVCSDTANCPFSINCNCSNSFNINKSEKSYIHILCNNPFENEEYKFDSSSKLVVGKEGTSFSKEYSFQNVPMTLETKPATNFSHFIVATEDLETGNYFASLIMKKNNSDICFVLHFLIE